MNHARCETLTRTQYKCWCTPLWEGTRCHENIARKKNLALALAKGHALGC